MPDVTIIGAGPAGLTAARVLVQAGVRDVQVLERNPQPGGLPRFCDHPGWGVWDLHRFYNGPRYAAELVRRAAGANIRTNVTVTALVKAERSTSAQLTARKCWRAASCCLPPASAKNPAVRGWFLARARGG